MKPLVASLMLFLSWGSHQAAICHELSGFIELEGWFFIHEGQFDGQERQSGSIAFQPEYFHEWRNGSSFTFVPIARLDATDDERTHFDVRELNLLWLQDRFEVRFGIGKVFWGVTEFLHLVDIINQTDLVESIDGEDKLGQTMIQLSIPSQRGTLDLFALPWFRERTFPGRKGRLRSALVVDTDNAVYGHEDKEHHIDLAARYSHTIGDIDFGFYHFNGTGRDPTLIPTLSSNGQPELIPFYELINQNGLDLQAVAGDWLWKLEAIHRRGQGDDFLAMIGGFEYTLTAVFETSADLGLLGEWAYDERGDDAATAFENDLILGLRLAVNDAASSELLAGFGQDLDSRARVIRVEGSRRFGNNLRLFLEIWAFIDQPEDDFLSSMRDDDFVEITLAYYF